MAIGIGMRAKDMLSFLVVARQYTVILLVRHTNEAALRYVGLSGYYPKPGMVKAKTADFDPPAQEGAVPSATAGLVVHPGMHPGAYGPVKISRAMKAWDDGLKVLSTAPPALGKAGMPGTWSAWGVERPVAFAPAWRWRVDVQSGSRHYGCLQLCGPRVNWSYLHGDYDLKDVIVPGREAINEAHAGTMNGVLDCTPLLPHRDFETIRTALNTAIGAEMVQHGAEAQFAWHGDEPITVVYPDWTHLLLVDAITVQLWYKGFHRSVLAEMKTDYTVDVPETFHLGPPSRLAPGRKPRAGQA